MKTNTCTKIQSNNRIPGIVAVSFIGRENRSTQKKPVTPCKSLKKFIT